VIIVHGTFAKHDRVKRSWYEPDDGRPGGGPFISKLDAALQERGSPSRCWAHCVQGNPIFQWWPGENSWVARTRAASELGDYVLKLRNEGWCCHIVAHSHGGNVVLEALPQITTALHSKASLGKIVTLGTPFMDTMSPILQRIRATRRTLIGLSWIGIVWLILLSVAYAVDYLDLFDLLIMTFPVPVVFVVALNFLSRKSQNAKPAFSGMLPTFLAIVILLSATYVVEWLSSEAILDLLYIMTITFPVPVVFLFALNLFSRKSQNAKHAFSGILPAFLAIGIWWSATYVESWLFPKSYSDLFDLLIITFPVPVVFVVALNFFGRKSQNAKPAFSGAAQMQPKFLAISSPKDEPWQLLNYMRNASNPMAVETNLICYLISFMRSHISRSGQVARIYDTKSYYDLKFGAKLFLGLAHLMWLMFFVILYQSSD
jgi:hypothetical protein